MREYLAKPNKLAPQVFELEETWNGINGNSIRRKLNVLLKQDPHLIEAYNARRTILEAEDALTALDKEIKKAYEAVLEMILDDQGNYPDHMPWEWLENRPLLEALAVYAYQSWQYSKWEIAEEVYKKLLTMNPLDNQGSRFYYLGVLERIHPRDFLEKFNGEDPEIMFDWFEEEGPKHGELKHFFGK